MGWQNRESRCVGSIVYRGSMPPRAEEYEYLHKHGITISRGKPLDNAIWTLEMNHPQWGAATMLCLRDFPPPPRAMIEYDANLTQSEKELAVLGASSVSIMMKGTAGNILRDRKKLLRYLRAALDENAVFAMDHVSLRLWSADALDDELAHDADLDVESLYTLHVVCPEAGKTPTWLHTHGLAEMGFFDFDVLQPSGELLSLSGADVLRAMAFAIVEGTARKSMPRLGLAHPTGDVRLVDVRDFCRRADAATQALRLGADEGHNRDRCILCEPGPRFFGRWFGRVVPSRMLSNPPEGEKVSFFSNEATQLMAERAARTYELLQRIVEDLAEFSFKALVKLGYTIDADAASREHLWFEAHELQKDRIDATLINEPFQIARMKAGARDWHSLEHLSDWVVPTPIGEITPRDTRPWRAIRSRREEFRKLMKEYANAGA